MTTSAPSPKPHRVFATRVAAAHPLDLAKVEKKGRSKGERDSVLRWTIFRLNFSEYVCIESSLPPPVTSSVLSSGLRDISRDREATTPLTLGEPGGLDGHRLVCGVRVETVERPLMRKIRALDKLVDEPATGRAPATGLRS